MPVGFCDVEVPGLPPANVHDHDVGVLVLTSVKSIASPSQITVLVAKKSATGGVPEAVES